MFRYLLLICLAAAESGSVTRVYFTNCRNPGWTCINNIPIAIEYSCRSAHQHDIITHIKDFYTGLITSVTIKDCASVKVYLDCPQLLVPSRLLHFAVRDSEKLEFSTLVFNASKQTPMNFTIDNVRDITSIPTATFKSPSNGLERKCFGNTPDLHSIVIKNSKIGTLNYHSISNVTNIKMIAFENVEITDIHDHAIEAVMDVTNSEFVVDNIKVNGMQTSAINVQSTKFSFRSSNLEVLHPYSLNITSNLIEFRNNTVQEVKENGLHFTASATEISQNTFRKLKTGAMQNSKCLRKQTPLKYFYFSDNTIVNVEPFSLYFDSGSCRAARATIGVRNNRMDCRCQHASWLGGAEVPAPPARRRSDLDEAILARENNNTCHPAPCLLPVEVLRTLRSDNLCRLNLAPQVMCYVYYDRRVEYVVGVGDDIDDGVGTEPAAAFYLVRHAQARSRAAGAQAFDRATILSDGLLDVTNRTTLDIMFDSSRGFEETLRNTSSSRGRGAAGAAGAAPQGAEGAVTATAARCAGAACATSVADNKQRALDFYKYLYAQLHADNT